jgi:hypothetical protein
MCGCSKRVVDPQPQQGQQSQSGQQQDTGPQPVVK